VDPASLALYGLASTAATIAAPYVQKYAEPIIESGLEYFGIRTPGSEKRAEKEAARLEKQQIRQEQQAREAKREAREEKYFEHRLAQETARAAPLTYAPSYYGTTSTRQRYARPYERPYISQPRRKPVRYGTVPQAHRTLLGPPYARAAQRYDYRSEYGDYNYGPMPRKAPQWGKAKRKRKPPVYNRLDYYY
jgi:hypothetical protein